jgi:tetratricopeptide (TPR) repeat protein
VHDLFQLQDALTQAIVAALHVPLSAHDHRALKQDVPVSATAYELFLRGNKLAADSSHWLEVRDLYERAVELDPGYAPAWARLGRVLRVIAKYGGRQSRAESARAERAFERALALNPDLATAHYLYAHLEAETGRASDAMMRLLTRARSRSADPELFAGLVTTCRYCGLLDESIAAYRQVCRLDPATHTSVAFAYYLRGDYAQTITTDSASLPFASTLARIRLGDDAAAIAILNDVARATPHEGMRIVTSAYTLAVAGDVDALLPKLQELRDSGFTDPEGYFHLGAFIARAGAQEPALSTLDRAVSGGFYCPSSLRDDPFWDSIRETEGFARLLAKAEAGSNSARAAFDRVQGASVLRSTS